jgi:NAD-dependent deacetylase
MKKVIVFTGAGISAESGVSTFRDAGGLWEGYRIEDVATPAAWMKNPTLVLDFYNKRRLQLKNVTPNPAHQKIASWEQEYDVIVITQNVDNLHERAGSTSVIHLHGELTKVRSEKHSELIYYWTDDLHIGNVCEKGTQLRPHIVWFGEEVPTMEDAIEAIADADIFVIVGTSMQVYPAASLYRYVPPKCKIYYIDPKPGNVYDKNIIIIPKKAVEGIEIMDQILKAFN